MYVSETDPRSSYAFEARMARMAATPYRRPPPPIPPPPRRVTVVVDNSPEVHSTAWNGNRRAVHDAVRQLPGPEVSRLDAYDALDSLHTLSHGHGGVDTLVGVYAGLDCIDGPMRAVIGNEVRHLLGCG